jgi:[ribosomal protein S18]-alanine N-acetyltransferase
MLRPATIPDLELVSTWVRTPRECELWAGARVHFPLTLASLSAAIDFVHQGGLVLLDGDATVAFGQIVSKARRRAHLARLIVAPEHRGRGFGKALVGELLEQARTNRYQLASLNVDPANAVAIALYGKLGFVDAERPADEPDPFGSRYMERAL